MTNQDIREAVEEAMELYEDTDTGIASAIISVGERLGITVRRVEKALGW